LRRRNSRNEPDERRNYFGAAKLCARCFLLPTL
jgi:hypothetical protein